MNSPQTMIYTVEHDGQIYDIEGPAGATPEDLQGFLGQSGGNAGGMNADAGQPSPAAAPAEDPGELQFNDDPDRVLNKLHPEDEAQVTNLLRAGDVDGAAALAHSKGFTLGNTDQIKQAIAQGKHIGSGAAYTRAPAKDMGTRAAFENGVSQGASLGTSDELHGLVNGISSAVRGDGFSDAYNRTVDEDRAQLGSDEENHWLASLSGNLAGGLVLPLGLERAGITQSTRAIGIAARDAALADGLSAATANKIAARAVAKRLAGEGAAYGGAYGTGASEGGPGERLLGGASGAAAGAFAGGIVFPAISRAAGGLRRGVNAAYGAASRAFGSVTESGAQDQAGNLLRSASLRPIEDVLADIALRDVQASGAQPTLAEVANDAGLAGFQRGFTNTDSRAGATVGERNASNALARTRYASDAFGDGSPQAVQDYAGSKLASGEASSLAQQAERRAAAEGRVAGEQRAASAESGEAAANFASSRDQIGPVADRSATGSAAREQFETRYDAARRRTSDAYNDPRLADNDPVSLRPAELADHYLPSLGGTDVRAFREEATNAVRAALPPKPQSLLQFIRARGGVLADGVGADDLRHSGLTAKAEPTLINSRGKPLDDQLEAAVEAGFVPPETSLADFAEEVAGEHRGLSRLVRPEDMNAAADHEAAVSNQQYWSQAFGERDLDPRSMTDAEWSALHTEMAGKGAQSRTLFDLESQPSRGSVMGPFQKDLDGIRARYFGDGATSIPGDAQAFLNDVMNADTAGIKTLEGWERRAYDMAARAPDRTTGAFLRGVGRVIGNKASAEGGPARAEALNAARRARAEQGRVFETGDAAKAFGRDRYNNPTVGDTTVPTRIVRPGAAGGDTADGLIAAVGPEVAETLVRQELRRAVEEAGVQTEAQARTLATRFGEVAKRFPGVESDLAAVRANARRLDAAKSGEAAAARSSFTAEENASIKERSAFHDAILASPLGRVADAAVDPSSYIAGLLRRSDDGRQLRYLARQVTDNADALGGMRRALGDFIETTGAGPNYTQAGDRVPSIAKTRKAVDVVVKRAGDALTMQQKIVLRNVSRELTSANFAVTAGRPTGSDTAMNRSLERMINAVPTGGHGGPIKSLLSKVVSALSNEDHVKQLLTQSILDPDFAALLLKRPTAKHLIDVQQRFAGRKGTIFAGQATTQATAHYRTGTR